MEKVPYYKCTYEFRLEAVRLVAEGGFRQGRRPNNHYPFFMDFSLRGFLHR